MADDTSSALPVFDDVLAAAERIADVAIRTPLIENERLNELTGARVFVKAENLQRTGSFKIRGATNRLRQLDAEQRARGVVAWSSGNHAQGVACAARLVGTTATIVMPRTTARIKIQRTQRYGADIILHEPDESREAIAFEFARTHGAVVVPSYDDPAIIAGQATVTREIIEQARESIDMLFTNCGGGGLTAGACIAVQARSPATEIHAVEPAAFDDHRRSLAAGTRVANEPGASSICDALLAPTPGELTFAINRDRLAGVQRVTDAEVLDAMAFAHDELKLVLEPGGAVSLAAVLAGRLNVAGRTVAVIASGGNVERALTERALRANGSYSRSGSITP